MEPLVEIPRDQWPELRDLYRTHWPRVAEAYCFLDSQISCPRITNEFNINIYSPHGNIRNGTVAISVTEKYQIYIFPINDDLSAIENALLNTKLIDWNRRLIIVPSVKWSTLESLKRVCKQLDVNIKYDDDVLDYILDKNTRPYDISCPPNTYVGPLKPEHIDTIDKAWTFKSDTSFAYFKRLMENNLSYVLYSDKHEPIAWINIDECGSLSHLYCIESERNKGYGEFITKVALNDLLNKGRHVLVYTLGKNYKPQKMFVKMGFEPIGQVSWVFLSKHE
ncbi:uncharacterized protein LOC113521957 [Galleria mellonella]|uniref:Glycine N-acyltransferase-like protein n=1 Tax=Galleria mellonella TaxID=7137 RepID=A0A6J1X8B1_GALME|nr:uncharacterized protein LOC113521957 [Galleria mellonella]XP_031765814.1 uncharacterized protein LOC113521957 [Galleria mellonella]